MNVPPSVNYQKKMEEELSLIAHQGLTGDNAPTLLLHSCCGPCSSAVIASLAGYFRITVFYYNPNIDQRAEYDKRAGEQKKLIARMPTPNPVAFLEGEYDSAAFLEAATPFSEEKEGGARCTVCYGLRLERTAKVASDGSFDYFTTTLSVSPMKDAVRLNSIGEAMAHAYGSRWLWSDFKKKDGYKKSIELSREYELYRQDYCGCAWSRPVEDRRS